MLSLRTVPLVLLLVAVLVYAGFAPSVQGNVRYTPGLKAGDAAWYDYSGVSVPLKLQITVLSVAADATVNANFTSYYSDGNANSTQVYLNIFNGDRNVNNVLFAIGTGLKVGDPVYNNYAATIASVQTQSCGGPPRTTDFIAFPQNVQLYWDQNTGLMCRYNSPSQSLFMSNTTLWDSNPPVADPFLVGFEVSTLLGAPLVVLIVFVFLRKRRRGRR